MPYEFWDDLTYSKPNMTNTIYAQAPAWGLEQEHTHNWWQLLVAGWILAPVVDVVERYVWNDWEFAATLAVLVCVDTICGLVRAWQSRTVNSKRFNGVVVKVIAYGAALVVVHTLSRNTVRGEPSSILAELVPLLDAVVYGAIVFREVLSIHEHLSAMGFPLLPQWLLNRMKKATKIEPYTIKNKDSSKDDNDSTTD